MKVTQLYRPLSNGTPPSRTSVLLLTLHTLPLQDIDPLADTVPPRHAVESDEEEDEYNPLSTSTQSKSQVRDVEVNIVGDVKDRVGGALVIVTGEAGRVWTRSGTLGEQSGAVMVNQVQVRSLMHFIGFCDYDELLTVCVGL